MTPTELKALEKIVYPGRSPAPEFHPSLDGSAVAICPDAKSNVRAGLISTTTQQQEIKRE